MFICGAKGVESVQDMFRVSDLGDQIMVPLNDRICRRWNTVKWENDAN